MTVAELIKLLERCDPSARVVGVGYSHAVREVSQVEVGHYDRMSEDWQPFEGDEDSNIPPNSVYLGTL